MQKAVRKPASEGLRKFPKLECMLPSFIIDKIQDMERRKKEDGRKQPRAEIETPRRRPDTRPEETPEDERGAWEIQVF